MYANQSTERNNLCHMAHDIEAALQRLHVAWVGGRAVVRVQFRPLNITRGTARS